MAERTVIIIGLPASGKTTYLAALWHVVTACEIDTALRFRDLRAGNSEHLNTIARRWRNAVIQERTALSGNRLVSMNLVDPAGRVLRVTFPDVPGEAYRRMWEDRDCEAEVAQLLRTGDVLLFVHADTIQAPSWTVEEVAIARAMGQGGPEGGRKAWTPGLAPTQVQVVDLLQLLRMPPLDVGPRRLGIMLSAWDKVRDEGLAPAGYLEAKLPLLGQYLRRGADGWDYRVYGVSAQGGEYDKVEGDAGPEANELRKRDRPSTRIQLVGPVRQPHDLTEPLAWLTT